MVAFQLNKIVKSSVTRNHTMGSFSYTFSYKNRPLKIGIAGAKSHARLSSQHYLPNSCKSNLAKKILKLHSLVQFEELTNIQNIGNWIKENCERIDLIYTNIDNWTLRLI